MDRSRSYSPTLSFNLIKSLYRVKRTTGIPIATYVRQVVQEALSALNLQQGVQVCTTCLAQGLDEEGQACRGCAFRSSRRIVQSHKPIQKGRCSMKASAILSDLKEIIARLSSNQVQIQPGDLIFDVFGPVLNEVDHLTTIMALEVMRDVDLPDPLAEDRSLTFGALSQAIAALPKVSNRFHGAERILLLSRAFQQSITQETDGVPQGRNAA